MAKWALVLVAIVGLVGCGQGQAGSPRERAVELAAQACDGYNEDEPRWGKVLDGAAKAAQLDQRGDVLYGALTEVQSIYVGSADPEAMAEFYYGESDLPSTVQRECRKASV